MNDKLREEFEAMVEATLGLSVRRLPSGAYQSFGVYCAWEGWQASRAALVVEFPDSPGYYYNGAPASATSDPMKCWHEGYMRARERVEAAGVKVRP